MLTEYNNTPIETILRDMVRVAKQKSTDIFTREEMIKILGKELIKEINVLSIKS